MPNNLLSYTKESFEHSAGKDLQIARNYGYLLSLAKCYQEAIPVMEKLIMEGQADEPLKAQLKVAYEKLNPGKDFLAYISSLEAVLRKKTQEEVAKLLVNEQAPNFVLKDASGRSVSLADFKGKTIVLDFWATWCSPCKKSFPAMQMAVNKYKNVPNVKFLFIHTWEKVADPLLDAKSYLSSNNYNFDLYMDVKDSETKVNQVVSAFGVKGIPAKFVIDGNGKIRFKMTGFSGGNDAAVEELSAMIELTRNI